MNESVDRVSGAAALPGWVNRRSMAERAVVLGLGVAGLVLAAKVSFPVPMSPVPVTLQTFAVTVVGALLGWRLGGLCLLAYLALGAAGVPVFSGDGTGLAKFQGPTAGYLFAFPLAAVAVGAIVERGWVGASLWRLCLVMLLGNAVCLGFGAAWLGAMVGAEKALAKGLMPFLPGAALKSLLAAVSVKGVVTGVGGRRG